MWSVLSVHCGVRLVMAVSEALSEICEVQETTVWNVVMIRILRYRKKYVEQEM